MSQTSGLVSNSAFPLSVTTNMFTVTDGAGLTSSCSFAVTITDNQAPTITCPAGQSVSNDANACSAVISYTTPSISDNCPGAQLSQTAGLPSASSFPVGTNNLSFSVSDGASLSASCSFSVVVSDTQLPTIGLYIF